MENERVASSELSLAPEAKEPRVKRALLYQLSYAPTPLKDNTSIGAPQAAAHYNGLGSDTEGHAVNCVVLGVFA